MDSVSPASLCLCLSIWKAAWSCYGIRSKLTIAEKQWPVDVGATARGAKGWMNLTPQSLMCYCYRFCFPLSFSLSPFYLSLASLPVSSLSPQSPPPLSFPSQPVPSTHLIYNPEFASMRNISAATFPGILMNRNSMVLWTLFCFLLLSCSPVPLQSLCVTVCISAELPLTAV